jgi:hypothetical protein
MRIFWVETPPDGSITCSLAARHLGIAPSTLGVYCAAGTGPDNYRDAQDRIGRRYYLRPDLDRWLVAHPNRGRPPGGRPKVAPPPSRPKVREVEPRTVRGTDRLAAKLALAAARTARKTAAARETVEILRRNLARAELQLAGLLAEGGP